MKIIIIISIFFSGCATMQLENDFENKQSGKAKITHKIILKRTERTLQAKACADYLGRINAN